MENYFHKKCVKGLLLRVFNCFPSSLKKGEEVTQQTMCASTTYQQLSYLTQSLHVPQSSLCLLRVPRWGGVGRRRPGLKSEDWVQALSFVTPWTAAQQAPQSMGFPRQEYWSWLPFPSPGDLPHPGIEPTSPALAGRFSSPEPLGSGFGFSHCYLTAWCPDAHLI